MKLRYFKVVLYMQMIAFLFLFGSCKKFIEVKTPVTSTNSENVYDNDNTAISVLTGMYEGMVSNILVNNSIGAMSLLPELTADNLSLFDLNNATYLPYYQNDLKGTITASNPSVFWRASYQQIYIANAAVEGLTKSSTLTPVIKQQLLGEAKFMRAFYFFYLVNLYGDVPLVLSTDYKENSKMGRAPEDKVYEQIVSDLKEAQNLLSVNYVDVTLKGISAERIRINKAVATAFLARVYLYKKDWLNAEAASTAVIENNSYALVSLDSVFLKNSKETLWALQPTQSKLNTWEGYLFQLPSTGPNTTFPFCLSNQLINGFEPGDQRLNKWTANVTANSITYFYPYKYKVSSGPTTVSEYEVVLRLAEQYLIRAEARAEQDKLTGDNSAASDLNAIRTRAGLLPTTATTKQELLDAVMHERQVEFFTEWGHRWLDLKRTGKIDEVMSVVCQQKGGVWAAYKALYPILQSQIDINPGMKDQQNPGYTD